MTSPMTDLDWLKSLRELATEGTFHAHGAGSYKLSAADSRLIAAAANLLGPLVEVLDHAAGMAGWADDGTYEAIKSALAAIAAERQRQELPK